MLFKRICTSFLILLISGFAFSQKPKKRHKWRYIGPSEIPASNAKAGQWSSTGTGWIEDIEIGDKYWFAGAITGGLYRSEDEGKTWQKIDKDSIQLGTLDLEFVNGTLYRCTGLTHYDEKFGLGIYKSTDFGENWSEPELSFKAYEAQPIWSIDANNKGDLIACSPDKLYMKPVDSLNWSSPLANKVAQLRTVLYSNKYRNTVFAAGSLLYKSIDNGKTWNDVTSNLTAFPKLKANRNIQRIAICFDPNTKGRMLAFYSLNREVFVDESLDEGRTFTNIHNTYKIRRIDINHAEIAVAPGDPNCIVLGGVRCFISKDGGKHFFQATYPVYKADNFAHDDIRGMHLKAHNDFYLATDGGVFRSEDTGRTWSNVSGAGLNTMQIYGIGLLNDDRRLLGTQDLGTFLESDGSFINLFSLYGDGGDGIDLDSVFAVLLSGTVRLMDKQGLTRSKYVHPPTSGNHFTASFIKHPADNGFFYVGKELWYNNGSKWLNKTKNLPATRFKITGFDINKSAAKQMIVSYDQPTWDGNVKHGKLYKTLDGGKTWEDLTSTLPILSWRFASCIETNPTDPNEIYVGLGVMDRDEIHKVYKSIDGGVTWTNYSEGLPPFQTFKMEFFPKTKGLVLTTLKGAYYRNASMPSWTHLNGSIPNISIRDFEIDYTKRKLYAATYGNGLWELKVPRRYLKARR